jgi:NTE family protein
LQERGYNFDFIGGTSVGAALAAAMSLAIPPREIMDVCEHLFLKSKAMSRLTVPKYGVLDHTRLDNALKHHYGAYNVEDMPLNFFAIATSLTDNDERVLRSGPLWQAVRASTAVPGVFPPFIMEDGEVLIDGGLLNNVPITVMRDLKSGPNLILNFLPPKPWRARTSYEDFPNRGQAIAALFKRAKKGAPRKPTMFSILSRTMVVNSRRLLQHTDIGDDVLLNISTLRGMGFMNWKRGRELFDVAYNRMNDAMTETSDTEGASMPSKIAHLKAASRVINETVPD